MGSKKLPTQSTRSQVDAFLRQVAATPPARSTGREGRLIFAMDATASREPTWDHACHLQAQMFAETATLGGLAIQLCYYRGFNEFDASDWLTDTAILQRRMTAVHCLGGHTQIGRVLRHAIGETKARQVDALVFVGDCMEEDADELCHLAGELGIHGVPVFVFQEGHEPNAERVFRQIARLTRGAYSPFDAGSAQQLRDLLSAVAVYAAGGRRALADFSRGRGETVKRLTRQLENGGG
jgi:hypothetical protein